MLNVATTQSNQNVSSTPLHQRTSNASKPTMTIANGTLMDTKNALYALSKVPGNKQSHDTMDATATALLDWTRNRFSSDRSHCGNVATQQPHRASGAGHRTRRANRCATGATYHDTEASKDAVVLEERNEHLVAQQAAMVRSTPNTCASMGLRTFSMVRLRLMRTASVRGTTCCHTR